MNKLDLNDYHHLVILSDQGDQTTANWSEVFGFEKPKHYESGPIFKKFLGEKYPSYYRGKFWWSDFSQSVFSQKHMFFEIDGMGKEEDCFTEFYEKYGNGVCYLGYMAYEKKDAIMKRLNEELGCDTIVDQKFPGGDWSVMETEKLLGCNLCIKESPGGDHTIHPVLDDFKGVTIITDDTEEKLTGWMKLFAIKEEDIERDLMELDLGEKKTVLKRVVIRNDRMPIELWEDNGDFEEKRIIAFVSYDDKDGKIAEKLVKKGVTLYGETKEIRCFSSRELLGTDLILRK